MADNKRMVKVFACAIGLTGLGVIIAEVINSLGWSEFHLAPVIVTVPMLSFYGFYEIVVHRINQSAISIRTQHVSTFISWTNAILSLIGLILLLSIPLLWWGVIKRLAQSSSQGGRFF